MERVAGARTEAPAEIPLGAASPLPCCWPPGRFSRSTTWRAGGSAGRAPGSYTHWLDTLVLLLHPPRVVRVYEAVPHRRGRPRFALHARVIVYAGLSVALPGFAGAPAVYRQEHRRTRRDDPDVRRRRVVDLRHARDRRIRRCLSRAPGRPAGRGGPEGVRPRTAGCGDRPGRSRRGCCRCSPGRRAGARLPRGPRQLSIRSASAPPRPSRSSRGRPRTECRSPASRPGSGRTPCHRSCRRRRR
ncbi:hypothetical protein T45_08391 [Streptomyces turgidiscabies]|nr:hypothetical protein T45_08391 [Streptomyces turgidiscabies]